MKLVDALKHQAARLRSRLLLGMLGRSELIYVHSTRIQIGDPEEVEKYRITMLIRAHNLTEADAVVDSHLQEISKDWLSETRGDVVIKRLQPRPLGHDSLDNESDAVLQLLARLRRQTGKVVSSIDRILHQTA